MNKVILVYIIALIVGFSYGMHNPIVPLFSKDLGASYSDLGVIGFANFIPYMFIPLFVGLLLDRFNKGLLLSLGLALDTISIYLLSVADSVPQVIIFRTLVGVAHSFFWPPCESIISQSTSPQNRVKAISRLMAFFVVGLMIGPLVGSFLFEHFDTTYRMIFQIAAFAIATSLVFSLVLSKDGKTNRNGIISFASAKHLMKFPTVIAILLFCSVSFGVFLAILPVYMSERSISESNIELLFFVFGISRLVSLLTSNFLMKKFLTSLLLVIASISSGMLILFYSHSILEFSVAVLVLGFGFSVYFPLTFEIIMRKTKENVGALIGAYEATFGMGWAFGPLIIGVIANSFGSSIPYLILFVTGLFVLGFVFLKKKEVILV
ncbi:Major facilitator superfamily transporter [Nitrosotalea devaniterrae]|uniref:Major facilitator superfamily transporter n=1 Tax=Nitrosotalea devaniterrae TaxID=1078905 RepID=A0A128A512_9ARCH|nr:Major facilitator superfamily transporter [Candidatus Nitrosotalea devanaterra]